MMSCNGILTSASFAARFVDTAAVLALKFGADIYKLPAAGKALILRAFTKFLKVAVLAVLRFVCAFHYQ